MVKIKWNMAGFRALRTDPKVADDLHRRAERIADAAGHGFEAGERQVPRRRAHATVYAATTEAKRNANQLLIALQAGRG